MDWSPRAAVERRPVVAFLGLACGVSWSAWGAGAALGPTGPGAVVAVVAGAFGPAVAAVFVTGASGASVRSWLRARLRWRVSPRWYALAVLVPVLAYAVAAAVLVGAGATVQVERAGRGVLLFLGGLPVATLLTGGNEELGWRGFLLPRLQQQHTALRAGLLVGLAWAGWHLPLYLLPLGLTEGPYLLFVPFVVPASVVLTWLYNSAGGSVLPAMVLHGSLNAATGLFVGLIAVGTVADTVLWSARVVGVLAVVALLLAVYDRTSLADGPRATAVPGAEP